MLYVCYQQLVFLVTALLIIIIILVTGVNCTFRVTKVIGYQPPELLGKSVFDFFHPDDQTHMRESFEQGL